MISQDAMMAAKIALLERVAKDLLADRFSGLPDPIAAAEQYAEARKIPGPHAADEPTMVLIYETMWAEFLDDLVSQVRAAQGRQSR